MRYRYRESAPPTKWLVTDACKPRIVRGFGGGKRGNRTASSAELVAFRRHFEAIVREVRPTVQFSVSSPRVRGSKIGLGIELILQFSERQQRWTSVRVRRCVATYEGTDRRTGTRSDVTVKREPWSHIMCMTNWAVQWLDIFAFRSDYN